MCKKKKQQAVRPEFTPTQAKRMFQILSYKDSWEIPLCVNVDSMSKSAEKILHTAVCILLRGAGIHGPKFEQIMSEFFRRNNPMELIGEYQGIAYCNTGEIDMPTLYEKIHMKQPELPVLEMFGWWLNYFAEKWTNAEELLEKAEAYFGGEISRVCTDFRDFYYGDCDPDEVEKFPDTVLGVRRFLACYRKCRKKGAKELFNDPAMEGFFHIVRWFHPTLRYENRPELFIEQLPALLVEIVGDYEGFTYGKQEAHGFLGVNIFQMDNDLARVFRERKNLPQDDKRVKIFNWCMERLPFSGCFSSDVEEINALNRIYDIPEEGLIVSWIEPVNPNEGYCAYTAGSLFIPYILKAILPELLAMLKPEENAETAA